MSGQGSTRILGRLARALLTAALIAGTLPLQAAAIARAPGQADAILPGAPYPDHCLRSSDALVRADELMANEYRLGPHPVATLPSDLAWNEDPLGDWNWQYQLHSLNFVRDLLFASSETGDAAYESRAIALVQDWLADNPFAAPPSAFSWNDHSTAWRAYTLACTADMIGLPDWLTAALDLHGAMLADPEFYVDVGNHALNQSTALLEVGRVLGRPDWIDLAAERINGLVRASIDDQGVTNEQSVGYQFYNWDRYTDARERLIAAGLAASPDFSRVDRMPGFLAHATLPDGTYEMLGDTQASPAFPIAGTTAEFAATLGRHGPKPAQTVAVYRAGFAFARTGWGEKRPFRDEVHVSLRWGPAPYIHGHQDALSLTMYGYGSRLLTDSGAYSYDGDLWRWYFKSRRAHNVVTVRDRNWNRDATSVLLGHETGLRHSYFRIRTTGYPGVTHTRRTLFSRRLGYVVVEDRLAASRARTFDQLWHLAPFSIATATSAGVVTGNPRGNVLIRQLTGNPTISFVEGQVDPIQGWVSLRFKEKLAAPVVRATQRGKSVRYVTLIVPAAGTPNPTVTGLKLTDTGYSFTITIGTITERVVVNGGDASITKVG